MLKPTRTTHPVCRRGKTNCRKRQGKIFPVRQAGSGYPTGRKFVEPIIVVDEETKAILARIPPAERADYFGLVTTVERLVARSYIDASELDVILERNQHHPLPPALAQYRQALASGAVKMQRGRLPPADLDRTWLDLAEQDFRHFRSWLERRKRFPSWSFVKKAEWWQSTPRDLAVMMVQHKYYPYLSEGRVANLLFPTRAQGD